MSVPKKPMTGGFPSDYPHRTVSAATRTNSSPSKLEKLRASDSRRIAEGLEPEGPVWAVDDNGNVFYYEEDLVLWLRKKIVRVTDSIPKPFKSNLPRSGKTATSNHMSPNDNSPTAA